MSEFVLEVCELNYAYPSAGDEPPFKVRLPKLRLRAGEVCALTGLSGCGKSTLLECLGCVRTGFEAEVFRLGELDVLALDDNRRQLVRKSLLSFMPQQGGLIPFLTVRENLKLQLEIAAHDEFLRLDRLPTLEDGYALLESLDIGDLKERYPHELSIGQRQRAAFCKALIHRPLVLLIDEPTSALDPRKAAALFSLMQRCAKDYQAALLVVTHDLKLVREHGLRRFAYATRPQETPAFWELKS
ncbi:MAG: ATP-binding cassette domain-containing protein [Succinivibrio sp.]|nr:ATP-binding cassette domain-containing protein [Succinivibrio sp.]